MKIQNVLIVLLILLFNGCSSNRHMEFKNVPINGNLNDFVSELTKSGFAAPKLKEENQIELSGVFLEKNCEIFAYGTKLSRTVYKVRVDLPEEEQDSIEYRFEKIKQMFTSQFGNGTSKYQQFQNSERFLFNEPKRIRSLSPGDFTRFNTRLGVITMVVQKGYISITYLDKRNNEIWKREVGEQKQNSAMNN